MFGRAVSSGYQEEIMRLKKATLLELKQIVEEEFDVKLDANDLEELAYSLVGYFDLLVKINYRHEVRKLST